MEENNLLRVASDEQTPPKAVITPAATGLLDDELYIRDRMQTSVAMLSKLSDLNQKKYKRLKRLEIVMASTIPFAIAISSMEPINRLAGIEMLLTVYAGVGGAIIALMNNTLELGGYMNKWKNYRSRAELLKREEYLYITRLSPYCSEDAFPKLVERVEKILNATETAINQSN